MGLVKRIKAGLEKRSHAKEWEKNLIKKIVANYGEEAAKQIIRELKPIKKESTYHTYVSKINMVYQHLSEGETLEEAIARAKKY